MDFDHDYGSVRTDFNRKQLKVDPAAYSVAYCLVGLDKKDGKERYAHNYAGCYGTFAGNCHYFFKDREPVAIINAVKSKIGNKETQDYWEFLTCNKTSPWRSLGKLSLDMGKGTDQPFIRVEVNEKTHKGFLVNLFIAARLGYDNTYSLHMYNHLRQAGWSQFDAMVTSIYFNYDPKSKLSMLGANNDHNAFSAHHNVNVKALQESKPALTLSTPLKSVVGYGGVQCLWTVGVYSPNINELPAYTALYAPRNYDGVFKKMFMNEFKSEKFPLTAAPEIDVILKNREKIMKAISA